MYRLFAGILALTLQVGFASITTYGTRASWLSAVQSASTIDFEGIVADNSTSNVSDSGITLQGVHFDSYSAHGEKYLIVVGHTSGSAYDWGSGAILHGPPERYLDPQFGWPAGISATLPAGITAIALDMFTVFPGGAPVDVILTTSAGEYTFGVETKTKPNLTFFGATSSAAISMVRMQARDSGGTEGYGYYGPYNDLDNFSFGVVAVPEPASAMLLLAGFSALIVWNRLRRRGKLWPLRHG